MVKKVPKKSASEASNPSNKS